MLVGQIRAASAQDCYYIFGLELAPLEFVELNRFVVGQERNTRRYLVVSLL